MTSAPFLDRNDVVEQVVPPFYLPWVQTTCARLRSRTEVGTSTLNRILSLIVDSQDIHTFRLVLALPPGY
jgi:hypothetical protein